MGTSPRRASREDFLTLAEVQERWQQARARLARLDAAIAAYQPETRAVTRRSLERVREQRRRHAALLGSLQTIATEDREN